LSYIKTFLVFAYIYVFLKNNIHNKIKYTNVKTTKFCNYGLLLIWVFLLVNATGCKKEELPTLSTMPARNVTGNAAESGGYIAYDGNSEVVSRGIVWSETSNPTIDNYEGISSDESGPGFFQSTLIGLNSGTTYYIRAYATNSVGTGYGDQVNFTTNIIDTRDGKVYQTVTIGNQEWMAENLKYLPSVVDPSVGSSTTPCYYVYGYDGTNVTAAKATTNYDTYGVLYNWTSAMAGSASSGSNPSCVQGVCPDGWHLPSDAEWTELTDYLGGESVAGGKLKETGTTHWTTPNTGTTNETGFMALPGGFRSNDGTFYGNGNYGYWWSSTEYNAASAWNRFLDYSSSNALRGNSNKELGFSVRCVRD
jgi:uncharacterized protein (TIGR02145 family)